VFLEQILCPWGYSDYFAGVVCGTCLVIGGMVGAIVAGAIADRTKLFVPVAKMCFFFCMLSVIFFTLVQVCMDLYAAAVLPSKARRSHDRASHIFDHNSPDARARELSKPSADAESLVVSI